MTGITQADSNRWVKFLDSAELGEEARLVGQRRKEHFLSGMCEADFEVLDNLKP